MSEPASSGLKRWLSGFARRLGVADPVTLLGNEIFDRSFSAPAGDPYHGRNGLVPHYLPLELSFSEAGPFGLRLALEPLGPGALPAVRRNATVSLVTELMAGRFPRRRLEWFLDRSEPWRTETLTEMDGRGGFFAAMIGNDGLLALKSYFRLQPDQLGRLPAELATLTRRALDLLPLDCRGVGFVCGREPGAVRSYLRLADRLDARQLEPLARALAVDRHLPRLLAVLDAIRGGRSLAAGSLFVELEQGRDGPELELHLALAGLADPAGSAEAIGDLFAGRPAAASWRRWLAALAPAGGAAGDLTLLALRLRGGDEPRHSAYLVPTIGRLRPAAVETGPGDASRTHRAERPSPAAGPVLRR